MSKISLLAPPKWGLPDGSHCSPYCSRTPAGVLPHCHAIVARPAESSIAHVAVARTPGTPGAHRNSLLPQGSVFGAGHCPSESCGPCPLGAPGEVVARRGHSGGGNGEQQKHGTAKHQPPTAWGHNLGAHKTRPNVPKEVPTSKDTHSSTLSAAASSETASAPLSSALSLPFTFQP